MQLLQLVGETGGGGSLEAFSGEARLKNTLYNDNIITCIGGNT